ncbi:MAG TPA: tetratricopeptide repeat protein [Pyrinomonadaceae bacterium]|nr:tetratricopeptide repeat protein [Pyrinomonadaceae bacterium]
MRTKISAAALAATLACAPFAASYARAATPQIVLAAAAQDEAAPSDAETSLFSKGQNYFIQGRYDQAAAVFNDFLKTYPNSVVTDLTLLWLGRSYMQLGQLQEAERVGQRLRGIKDTPFVDIYDTELKTARQEAAARGTRPAQPGANNGSSSAAARTQTTPAEVAAVRPTPTPAPVAPRTNETTTAPANGLARTETRNTPSLNIRREGNNRRPRVTNQRQPPPTEVAANTNNERTTPRTTPSTGSARRANDTGGQQQVARNNTNARTQPVTPSAVATPTPQPQRPAATSDPAFNASTTSAPVEPAPTAATQTGGFSITVKQVPGLQLALRRAALAASPGQSVQMPLVVTNTGNKEDQFRLETDLPAEFQPTFSPANGGSDTGMPIMVTPQLARGASYDVLLNIRIPDSAPDNQQRNFFVRAASQADYQVARVQDASLTVVAAALVAASNVTQETVMPGETFTQSISMRNQGSATARSARADFVFNPDFELVSANPAPLQYDRDSRTAVWLLGDLESRAGRDISVTLRAVPDALAVKRTIGRGTMKTVSLSAASNFDGPSITVGRVPRARLDAVSTDLTATPGDTIYIPFVVRNPSNYPESFGLQIVAPGAPAATIYADTNGDGLHQESEQAITQTTPIEPRGGQFPVLLRVDIPRSTPDRQQYAYNLVTRALSTQQRVATEAGTVLKVAAPRVRVRAELGSVEVAPGETFFYRLVLVNDGAGLAKNLLVNEQLPAALQFVSSEPSLSTQDAPGGAQRFTWRVPELAPGDTAVLKVSVRLAANAAADTTLTPRHSLQFQDSNGNNYQGQ